MKKAPMSILKKLVGTFILPVLMYLVMYWLCRANGKDYFGTWTMWRSLIADIGLSVACAMGIGLQFRCGRFDFSGGSIMLLTAIVAGNLAKNADNSPLVLAVACIVLCVACSLLVGVIYIFGRMPIVIVTIGMTLVFEAITCLVYKGGGINLVSNSSLKIFSSYPMVFVPFLLAVGIYAFYSNVATTGGRASLLANNQQAAVNIGVKETGNVLISYVYSGILFGLATMIYCSTTKLSGAFNSLQTVGSLFNNILPVFIGLTLAKACGDTIGIVIGALSLCIMNFGLEAVYTAELGNALSLMITGIFLLLFNFIAGQGELLGRIGAALTARHVSPRTEKNE